MSRGSCAGTFTPRDIFLTADPLRLPRAGGLPGLPRVLIFPSGRRITYQRQALSGVELACPGLSLTLEDISS
jgi:hypothetical protein